jgi:hypothetical protein
MRDINFVVTFIFPNKNTHVPSVGFAGRNWIPMNKQLMSGSADPVLPCDVHLNTIYGDLYHVFQKNSLIHHFCFLVPLF